MLFQKYDRIVFAGDSVTDMGSAQPVGEGLFDSLGFGYPRMVENLLFSTYPELNVRVTNSGVSGDTSRSLLARYQRDVLDLKPDWITICIGINDVWRQFDTPAIRENAVTPEEYEHNLRAMIEPGKDIAKGLFLLTPYYMEPNRQDPMRARMQQYVEICRKLSDEYGVGLVDFQAMYDDFFRFQHSALIAWDRVHPNQMGAMLMAKTFLLACGFDFCHVPEA